MGIKNLSLAQALCDYAEPLKVLSANLYSAVIMSITLMMFLWILYVKARMKIATLALPYFVWSLIAITILCNERTKETEIQI